MFNNRIILSLLAIIAVLSLSTYLMFKLYQSEKEDRVRYNNNMIALIKAKSRQQEITAKELKELYPKYDSIAKVLSIKTKFITNIIDTKYRFKDTTITKTVLKRDSISERKNFVIEKDCYNITGFVEKDTISITKKEFKDNITTFLYKDWEKKYLWGLLKFRPYYNAKVYSECMRDTIGVTNNIKIKD